MNGRKTALFLALLLIFVGVLMLHSVSISASADTLTVRPNSSGSFTEWTSSPAGTNWECVDEELQNGDTDYVYIADTGKADSYNLQNTAQTGSILNVRISTYAKQTTGNEILRQVLVISGVKYYGAVDHTPTTTYALYTNDWASNPATGSSWTWSDINSLEAGFESAKVGGWSGEIRVTQLYVEITYTPPVRDVAVIDVTPSPTTVKPGQIVNITVVVKNNGSVTETFNVTSYYDSTPIETQNVTDLAPGVNTTLLFVWNTTGVAEGNYTIKAEASVVPGETNTANNTFVDDIVTITAVVRDVAVIDVTPSLTKVNPDRVVNITVVAENQGTETETFNVTTYYDDTLIETKTVFNLASDANTTLTFSWSTTGIPEGVYTIKAVADVVLGETDTEDNTKVDGAVTIIKPTVYVSPASIIGPPPNITDTFTINITISDVVDLYAWQAGMTFNASILEALGFVEGPFLKDWAQSFPPPKNETVWMSGTINNTAGVITYHACSLTGYIPGASGNGTLGAITFRVKDYGNSTLHLTDVILLDSTLTEIPRNVVDGYFEVIGRFDLNLRVWDWDLTDNIQNAYVYVDSDVKISDVNGWANWTRPMGTAYVKVKWYGFWVNGTFSVTMNSHKTINVQCNIFDIEVTTIEGVQGAVLQYVNVTVYNATSVASNKIRTGITNSNGKVTLPNVPNSTLTFTCYDGATPQHVIANVTRTITTENQAETIICNQNYISTTHTWSIIGSYNSASYLGFLILSPIFSLKIVQYAKCLRERVETIRSKHKTKRKEEEGKTDNG